MDQNSKISTVLIGPKKGPEIIFKEPVAFCHPLEWDFISWIGREGKILEQAKKIKT